MPFRNSVTIVASPRSRVGKRLLARLLADFHLQQGRELAAFDLNSGGGTLAQFAPEHTTVSGVTEIKRQMALFDRLIADNGVTKLVDLGHESFEAFFAIAGQIGFAEEAHKRAIAPAVLFVITPDATAIEAYRGLRALFPRMLLAPVHNEIFGSAQHRDKYQLAGTGEALVHLPALTPSLRKYIDTSPLSFADAWLAADTSIPLAVQVELQGWLRHEFRELDLRILLADLQSSIGLGT